MDDADIILSLIMFCNINTLMTLYKINTRYRNILGNKYVLQLLTGKFSLRTVESFDEFVKEYKEYMLFILDKISLVYHKYLEFNYDTVVHLYVPKSQHFHCSDDIIIDVLLDGYDVQDIYITQLILDAFKNGDAIYNINDNLVLDIEKLGTGDYIKIKYDKDKLMDESMMVIPYQIVILQVDKVESFMCDRSYIIVDALLSQVNISRKIKNDDLTINDILIATGILLLHDKSIINEGDGYKILKQNNNMIMLEPNINNNTDVLIDYID